MADARFLLTTIFAVAWYQTVSGVTGLRSDNAPYKGFSGLRVDPDSQRRVLFHDQTIAVIEMDKNTGGLVNCELIEVNRPYTAKMALQNLTQEVGPSTTVAFPEMNALIQRCHDLTAVVPEASSKAGSAPGSSASAASSSQGFIPSKSKRSGAQDPGSSSIFSGILPGTKWCGTGDIAQNYYDLGSEEVLDRCCRTHDLCPVKVRAFQNRYGLRNQSFYTKSHCVCDDMLMECLRKSKRPGADVMGNIYFNLLRVPCVDDVVPKSGDADARAKNVRRFRQPKRY